MPVPAHKPSYSSYIGITMAQPILVPFHHDLYMIFKLSLALNLSDLARARKYMQNWKQYKVRRVPSQTTLTGTARFQLHSIPELIWSALLVDMPFVCAVIWSKLHLGIFLVCIARRCTLYHSSFSWRNNIIGITKLKPWQYTVSNGSVLTFKWRMSCLLQQVFLLGCSFAFVFVIYRQVSVDHG